MNVQLGKTTRLNGEVGDPQFDVAVVTIKSMATASGGFSEPRVLARAKECLFPDNGEKGVYAVTDTGCHRRVATVFVSRLYY
jgi:hypothetical protein